MAFVASTSFPKTGCQVRLVRYSPDDTGRTRPANKTQNPFEPVGPGLDRWPVVPARC